MVSCEDCNGFSTRRVKRAAVMDCKHSAGGIRVAGDFWVDDPGGVGRYSVDCDPIGRIRVAKGDCRTK